MNVIKTISEYVDIVRKGIENRDQIVEALVVSAQVKNGEIDEGALAEILRRKDICASCVNNSTNAKATGTYVSAIPYEHCTLCKCRIGATDSKEYCLSCECGIAEWNRTHPHQKMEVKWTPYIVNKENQKV